MLPLLPNRTESQIRHRIAKVMLDYPDGYLDVEKLLLGKPEKYVSPPVFAYLFNDHISMPSSAISTTAGDKYDVEEKKVVERQGKNDFAALIAAAANMQLDPADSIIHTTASLEDYVDDEAMSGTNQPMEEAIIPLPSAGVSSSSSNKMANMPITSLITATEKARKLQPNGQFTNNHHPHFFQHHQQSQQQTEEPPPLQLPSITRVLNGPSNRQQPTNLAEKSLQQLMAASRGHEDHHHSDYELMQNMDTVDALESVINNENDEHVHHHQSHVPAPPPALQKQQQRQKPSELMPNGMTRSDYRELQVKENARKAEALLLQRRRKYFTIIFHFDFDFDLFTCVYTIDLAASQPAAAQQGRQNGVMPPPAPRVPPQAQAATAPISGSKQPPPFARQGIQRLKAQQVQLQQQQQQTQQQQALQQQQSAPVSSYRSPLNQSRQQQGTGSPSSGQMMSSGERSPDDNEYLQSLIDSPQHARASTAAATAVSAAAVGAAAGAGATVQSQAKKKSRTTAPSSSNQSQSNQASLSHQQPQAQSKMTTKKSSSSSRRKNPSTSSQPAADDCVGQGVFTNVLASAQGGSAPTAINTNINASLNNQHHAPSQLHHHNHNLRFMSPTQDSMLLTEGGEGLQGIVMGEELSFL